MPRIPTHPGFVLFEEFLAAKLISPGRLATHIGIYPSTITELIEGRGTVTIDLALRLAKALGTTPEFWLNLQMQYDLYVKKAEHRQNKVKIERFV